MKKWVCVFLLFLSFGYIHAQKYRPWKLAGSVGYAVGSGSGSGRGWLFAIEPAYRISPKSEVGIKYEAGSFARGYSFQLAPGTKVENSSLSVLAVTFQWYPSKRTPDTIRAFLGGGIGYYSNGASSTEDIWWSPPPSNIGYSATIKVPETNLIGFYPRIGADFGNVSLAVEYNILPQTDIVNPIGAIFLPSDRSISIT